MTAPIWMAAPPEVHSALLSSGPGPGPLLEAAGAWISLSTEYTSVAEELSELLVAVQAGAWDGPSAEQYVAAHLPYLTWLTQAGADSAATAALQETAASAYTAALAAMPTLPELAANHAIHGALLATNFFGINTIPIALNEADYVRMWIQAATTMSTYQAVSSAATAAAPATTPAPQITKAAAASNPPPDPIDQLEQEIDALPFFQQLDKLFPPNFFQYDGGNIVGAILDGGLDPFTSYPPGTTFPQALMLIYKSFSDGLFVYTPPSIQLGLQNPQYLIQILVMSAIELVTHRIIDLIQLVYNFPALLTAVVPLVTAPVGAVGGFAGLAGLAALHAVPAAAAPIPVAPQQLPAVSLTAAPTVPSPSPIPAPAAPAPASMAPPSAPPPSPPVTGAEGVAFPYVVGPPGIGSGSGMSASAQAKTHEPTSRGAAKAATPAAAAAATRDKAPARRRRRATVKQLGRGYEYMDLDDDLGANGRDAPVASAVASDRGAGASGFTGAVHKDAAIEGAGLTTLAGDTFGGGPDMPMLPGTWGNDPDARERGNDT